MSVLLTILKVIGVILLVILGILIILIGLALFVPVRYRAGGVYNIDGVNVSARATWLWHIISAKIGFEGKGQPHIRVRLLWITLFDNLAENKKVKKTKNKRTKDKSKGEYDDNGDAQIQAASITPEETQERTPDEVKTSDINNGEPIYNAVENTEEDNIEYNKTDTDETPDNTQKENIAQKLKKIFKKLVDFVLNIKYTFKKICDTIADIRTNTKYYIGLLQRESTKAAFATCQGQLLGIFKSISPKKFRANLHLGFEDPSTLGEIMAIWGMLYPFHEGRINIEPEFEQQIIEGDFSLKGRVSLFIFVRAVIIIFFDKNIKRLYRQFKNKS